MIFRARRAGFTLIELGTAMVILGLLASAVLFAMYHVQEDAKKQRTRTVITKINELIMPEYNNYRTRAIPVRLPVAVKGRNISRIRLLAMREMMRMDLPDRISDVAEPPVTFRYPITPQVFFTFTVQKTARRRAYERIVAQRANPNTGWTPEFQGAECLYMILSRSREAGESGISSFRDSEIGDLDEDGMLEILDAWGNPIEFLRWAPGFTARVGPDGAWGVQGTDDNVDNIDDNVVEAEWPTSDDIPGFSLLQDIRKLEADPFDPFKVGLRWPDPDARWNNQNFAQNRNDGQVPFALYPLIISAGPDEIQGIRFELDNAVMNYARIQNPASPLTVVVNGNTIQNAYPNDPYFAQVINSPGVFQSAVDPNRVQLGQPIPTPEDLAGYLDNIHNHALGIDEVGE